MSNKAANSSVSVEIYDQTYRLSGVDPQHITALASLVDDKMRAVSAHGATVDSLRVAVLAALNIADELTELRARHHELLRSLDNSENAARHRANSLSNMLDEALSENYRDRVAV
ncbi:MAG: cell division protein ZapA [Janthinobacterium lividum]